MCGIYAEYLFGEAGRGPGQLERVHAALRHRGPDARGTWEGEGGGARVRLAHARLKIIDLSERAAQPMAGKDERVRLVFNGEIYGFEALRRELEQLGHAFRSQSDTEVLLRALEEWGVAALPRLRGMFAFALWDGRDGSLLFARDRLGIKPLYVAERDGVVAAASELRTLVAGGRVAYKPDPTGVASYLAFGSVMRPHTMVEGVTTLAPGSWLRVKGGKVERGIYWQLPELGASKVTDEREAAEETRRLVEDAVRTHLVSDVPLGAFLSGGMDSNAIVACAAEVRKGDVDTFTVAFPEHDHGFSEHVQAAAAAKKHGVRHHVLVLRPERALEEMVRIVDAFDQPSMDGPNTYVVSEAVRKAGITVALSGLGGDELFGGYGHLKEAYRARALWGALRAGAPLARAAAKLAGGLYGRTVRGDKALALLATGGDPAALYAARRALFLLGSERDLFAPAYAKPWRALGNARLLSWIARPGEPLAQAQTLMELTNYMLNTLLRDTDVMSMAHALEVRVPLLDTPLVEFVAGLPLHYRFKRGEQKPLLAAALGDRMPAEAMRPKMGFTLPFARWLRGPLRSEAETRLARLAYAGCYLNPPAVGRLWARFLAGEDRLWTRVWAIYMLDRWIEQAGQALTREAA